MKRRSLFGDRSGATALEFAIIGSIFIALCLAGLDAALLLWTKGVLQSTASRTARCAALGSTACSDAQQFAVTLAGNWAFPGIIAKANVVQSSSVCASHLQLMQITITCPYWATSPMPSPFGGKTLTATAYFPTTTSC